MMLDTIYAVETPEGIDLHFPVAGPVSRTLAWVIDLLIRSVAYIVMAIVLLPAGKTGIGLFLIFTFIMEWFYPVLFEVLRDGQTPGKSSMNIKVIHDDGTPVGWGASMIRNLLRVADFLPLFYGFGLVTMFLNSNFKRLGDLAAGTLVIYSQPMEKPIDTAEARPVRPPYPLQLEEQQAVQAFAERSSRLTNARSEELANLTGPLVNDRHDRVEALIGMAHWLAGSRGRRS
jgi:uncharacterized RDD family membrane protein YckC